MQTLAAAAWRAASIRAARAGDSEGQEKPNYRDDPMQREMEYDGASKSQAINDETQNEAYGLVTGQW